MWTVLAALYVIIAIAGATESAAVDKTPVATARVGDIVTTVLVPAAPGAIIDVLTDLPTFGTLLPTDCVGLYTVGLTPKGLGAQATLRYDMAAMHRKLEMRISRIERESLWLVDMDHAGNRGFISRYLMTPGDSGTTVTLKTALNAPPWPFAAYFFDTIQPEWQGCQARIIAAVGVKAGLAAPAPAAPRPAETMVDPTEAPKPASAVTPTPVPAPAPTPTPE